jgi:hypothetical protein
VTGMTKQERHEERREEMMELSMAVTGLQKLVERYLVKEDFSFLSNLLALTEELEERREALIRHDASLLYHKKIERSG